MLGTLLAHYAFTLTSMRYFAYCRKSTESEERQALSIPAQRDEIARIREKFPDIEIVGVLEEARTAKSPGRPVFNEMIRRIERGDAEGIIAWHPDRLARNSIDGGQIIYMLDRAVLKDLKFSTYTFESSSQGKFMLQIMFGYSKYYVDNLSENVKRGIRRKLEQGGKPGIPPPGYKNDPATHKIIEDPERFEQVQQMWHLLLSKSHTVSEIWRIADVEWGFRTRQHARLGGKPLAKSSLYKLFGNRFYCGFVSHNGTLYKGNHPPMLNPHQFEQAQKLIHRDGRAARKKHHFAFSGMIRCKSCGCAITAELHTNKYGATYEYYRCSKKRRDIKCPERYISRANLEAQILAFLRSQEVVPAFADWTLTEYDQNRESKRQLQKQAMVQLAKKRSEAERSLATLTDLRVRNLVGDDEFVAKRAEIQKAMEELDPNLAVTDTEPEKWLEFSRMVKAFNEYAPNLFETGDIAVKRKLLALTGSNFLLADRKLSIQAADFYDLHIRGPDFLSGRGQRENIRTFSDIEVRENTLKRLSLFAEWSPKAMRLLYPNELICFHLNSGGSNFCGHREDGCDTCQMAA